MSNNNYVPLLTMGGPNADPGPGYYTGATAGAFNETFVENNIEVTNNRSFAAFVAFVIKGSYQAFTIDAASPPPAEWLWGNYDLQKSGRGWSISMRQSPDGEGQIVARVSDGAGNLVEAATDISGAGFPSPVERVIFATLFAQTADDDGCSVYLGLNGSIVAATRSLLATGFTPSPVPARLGADPTAGPSIFSPNVEFISCGYAPVGPLGESGQTFPILSGLVGDTWRAFAESLSGNALLLQNSGADWKYRYMVASLAQGIGSNVIKLPGGSFISAGVPNYAVPADTMPNVGGQSVALGTTTPVVQPLTKTGEPPRVLGTKNLPYYTPPAVVFGLPPVPP